MEYNNDKEAIDKLAREMIINDFNVSIATFNPLIENSVGNREIGFSKHVFKQQIETNKREHYFSRTILIIGAGATYSEFKNIPLAIEGINKLENKLQVPTLLGFGEDRTKRDSINLAYSTKLFKRYLNDARKYKKKYYSPETSLAELQQELGFEGRLLLLVNIFGPDAILKELDFLYNQRFYPSFFYEIIAVFFKNRFIDVIINFNFDEILDNAIEDEMGSSEYYTIFHENDIVAFHTLLEDNRLKLPIYIKPHGTVSIKNSMKFTTDHYSEMSDDMFQFIQNIFISTASRIDPEKEITEAKMLIDKYNILIAGMQLDSLELNEIFTQQLEAASIREHISNINFYFFNKNKQNSLKIFENKFSNQYGGLINAGKLTCYAFSCEKLSLSDWFEDIYSSIQNQFNEPFKPRELVRQKILNTIFPKPQNAIEVPTSDSEIENLLKIRLELNLYIRLLKYNGYFTTILGKHERTYKYLKLYKQFYYKKNRCFPPFSIFLFYDKLNPNKIRSVGKNLYKINLDDGINQKIFEFITDLRYSSSDYGEVRNNLSNLCVRLSENNSYEIDLNSNDPALLNFTILKSKQFLTTNLALTFKFFEFCHIDTDWDRLIIIDEQSKPLFNLYKYYEGENKESNSYLHQILKSGKKVEVYSKWGNKGNSTISSVYNEKFPLIDFNFSESIDSSNQIAMFYNNNIAIKAIYFFKPITKSRINPVFFKRCASNKNNCSCYDCRNFKVLQDIIQETTGKYNNNKK